MSETLSLYRLQQIDTQIDRTRSELLEIQRSLDDDTELSHALENSRAAEFQNLAVKKELKQAELDLQTQRIKIEQIEASLYGGAVRNPKELQDLQNDAASMKKHMLTLEDRLLAAMESAEKSEVDLQNALSALGIAQTRRDSQNQNLDTRLLVLEKELETHKLERTAVAEGLSSGSLAVYEKLRQEHRGLAVAAIHENACAACGSTLTAAHIQFARSPAQVANCPSCGRILYGS